MKEKVQGSKIGEGGQENIVPLNSNLGQTDNLQTEKKKNDKRRKNKEIEILVSDSNNNT